jgi:general stress protein YciG
MPDFPKTEKIEIRLRQDLADRLPKEKGEKNAFVNQAVEHELDGKTAAAIGRKGGLAKSEAKTAAVRESGKKGGRPKKKAEQ